MIDKNDALEKYKMRRSWHDHEWVILSGRLQAFVMSQSLFAASGAFLYNTANGEGLLFIGCVALAITALSSIAIVISSAVLHSCHHFISQIKDESLKEYVIERKQPDWRHFLSVDVFSIGIVIICGTAWCSALDLYYLKSHWLYVGLATWIAILPFIYYRSLLPITTSASGSTLYLERPHRPL